MKISNLCFPIDNDKIYLARKKRGLGEGFINGFGGKMHEDDESIEAAAVREIKEEAGVEVAKEDLEKVGIIDFFRAGEHTFECHIYILKKWVGEFKETEEMEKAVAYDLSNPPYERMFPADRKWIPLICRGEKIRAKCSFDKDFTKELEFEYGPLQL